jgi:AraC-like DNA-binding protein
LIYQEKDIEQFEFLLDRLFSLGSPLKNIEVKTTHNLTVPSTWAIDNRKLNCYLCTIITEGEGSLYVNGKKYSLRKYVFYMIGPGLEHSIVTKKDSPIQLKSVHYTFSTGDNNFFFLIRNLNLSYYQQINFLMNTCSLSYSFSNDRYKSYLLRNSLIQIHLLFRDFVEEQPPANSDFSSLLHSLDSCRDYSIKDLSEISGYSEKAFIRKFKQLYGTTPHHYLIARKIEMCKYFLVHSELSIKEISISLNYRNQYEFSRQFKQYTELAPTEYRRVYRQSKASIEQKT